MTELPDHYPIAKASWEEKLTWLAAAVPPYARIFEAAPWYDRTEQVDCYLESLREWLSDPQKLAAISRQLSISPPINWPLKAPK